MRQLLVKTQVSVLLLNLVVCRGICASVAWARSFLNRFSNYLVCLVHLQINFNGMFLNEFCAPGGKSLDSVRGFGGDIV